MYVSNVPHVSNFICEQSYMCVIVHTTGQIKYLVSCILYLGEKIGRNGDGERR